MSRSGSYGQSFVLKHLNEGRLAEALAAADEACSKDPADSEARFERAQVLLAMERWEEGLADLRETQRLDEDAMMLDDSVLDDTLFSSLVAWGKQLAKSDAGRAVEVIRSYASFGTEGSHASEVEEWVRRFRGEREDWVKTR